MTYFDSHCHLQLEPFDGDREDVYQRARDAGVDRMTVIGIDADTARAAIEFCEDHDGCGPTAGLHPHDADRLDEERDELRALLDRPEVVAAGETGLDFHKEYAPRDDQLESLQTHVRWAIEVEKPLVFHCRDADDTLIDVMELFQGDLREAFTDRPPGVVHCFSGTADHLRAYREMGFYVSFSGILTFPNAGDLREAARVADPDGVLVETDAPFLAPQPHRGDRNEPAYVTETAERLASVMGLEPGRLAEITYENATDLFD